MSDILTRYWQSLSASARDMRKRHGARDLDDTGCDASTRTERLERIALYARAGYFNMGYTVDVFQSPADLPPE